MLLHTADWHLGKVMDGVCLLEDQRDWFMRFCDFVAEKQPELLLIAGDLFDFGGCTPEAKQLFDRIITRILTECGCPILAIGGNHDRPSWLQDCCRPYESKGLVLVTDLEQMQKPLVYEIDHLRVQFHLLPYLSSGIRKNLGEDNPWKAMQKMLGLLHFEPDCKQIAVAHGLILPAKDPAVAKLLAENQDGGAELIDSALFSAFDYAALGHIHASIPVEAGCCYAGTPMVYEHKELGQKKGFVQLDLLPNGIRTKVHFLPPVREVCRLQGYFSEILQQPSAENNAYVYLELLDRTPVEDGLQRMKQVFPHLLQMRYRMEQKSPSWNRAGAQKETLLHFLEECGMELTESRCSILDQIDL